MNLVQARQKSSTFNQLQVCCSMNYLPYICLSSICQSGLKFVHSLPVLRALIFCAFLENFSLVIYLMVTIIGYLTEAYVKTFSVSYFETN